MAQHRPFAGVCMVAVHLTDYEGNPVTDISNKLTLVEINNLNPKSCTYAEGPLNKQFGPTDDLLKIKRC